MSVRSLSGRSLFSGISFCDASRSAALVCRASPTERAFDPLPPVPQEEMDQAARLLKQAPFDQATVDLLAAFPKMGTDTDELHEYPSRENRA